VGVENGWMDNITKYNRITSTDMGLITEGSASHSAFRNSENHKETCSLRAKCSVWKISNYEICKARQGKARQGKARQGKASLFV